WNVVKVLWSSAWDPLFARDASGRLARRLSEMLDGEYQKCIVEGGAYMREHLFNDPELQSLVSHLSDGELAGLLPGGLDPEKINAGYAAAIAHRGQPTVVLAQTIKGFGLGGEVAARNVTHEQKNLTPQQLRDLRDGLGLPIPDDAVGDAPFYRPSEDSREIQY
ncbi:pyruvate dehydrogenase subunit E1, partial [mine drainage metagenome]